MLTEYIKLNNDQEIKNLESYTRSLIPTAVFGVTDPLKLAISAHLFDKAIYICKDNVKAQRAQEELHALTGKTCVYLPPKDDVLLYKRAFNKESTYKRLTALYEIEKGASFITCTFESLLQLFPKKVEERTYKISNEYPLGTVLKDLTKLGYSRVEFVENKGEFSLRGDILDVYPINSDSAFRCDFFGDELEKIRLYDAYLQKSGEEVRSFTLISASDFYACENKEAVKKQLDESLKKYGVLLAKTKAKQICDELKEIIDSDAVNSSLSFIAPLLDYAENGIFDYVDKSFSVVYDECKLCADNLDGVIREHVERINSLSQAGQAFDFSMRHFYDRERLISLINERARISLQTLTTSVPLFTPLKTVRLNVGSLRRYALKPDELFTDLKSWQRAGYRAIIMCATEERADRVARDISAQGLVSVRTKQPSDFPGIYITSDYLSNGFILHGAKTVVIGSCDLFVGVKEKKIKSRRKDAFSAPNVGDFAVHEKHGIGRVLGTERISTTEGTKDYIAIEYLGGDLLYVPVENMDRLTKYLGGDKTPKLSKIGGVEFEKLKEKVRASIAEMKINLKKLYSDRATKKGFRFSPDNELSKEFDDAFEFDETEDQLQSIAEIKKDMESDKVMDRLLCGDVGFGKTEVALRASFKAVMDGKQVAIVAPTTILTQQHYETALKRFEGFGVRIALLNRFCTPQKSKAVIDGLKNGEVDIVIGTHKLFSEQVKFKDLGLLVLDEEQCFGVEHKEKLRVLKSNVDTLTMTATPIPRTLHMSLSGIRDISLINTPPTNRIPVQAYVVEESDALIKDAVNRELSRGGQVFILYNRVDKIYQFASHVQDLIKDAKVVVGHGKMPKRQLEESIMSFYSGENNVLVSTTIIENGIDLPTANTLIVIDADNLGLFTLYQLKGRVGRSDKMAHAYFTYKQDKVLSETAYKRLSALMEHTELGSGYKIAMRDLEIRGAGNVLGREQHGHMDKIGYELYSKLLKEQLGEITKDFETELDIRMDAFIPEDYIEVSSQRLDWYKKISEIKNESERDLIYSDVEEVYGKVPKEVENLLDIALIKSYAQTKSVVKIVLSKNQAYMTFSDLSKIGGGIQDALEKFSDLSVLSFEDLPKISFTLQETAVKTLSLMTEFLHFSVKN